ANQFHRAVERQIAVERHEAGLEGVGIFTEEIAKSILRSGEVAKRHQRTSHTERLVGGVARANGRGVVAHQRRDLTNHQRAGFRLVEIIKLLYALARVRITTLLDHIARDQIVRSRAATYQNQGSVTLQVATVTEDRILATSDRHQNFPLADTEGSDIE